MSLLAACSLVLFAATAPQQPPAIEVIGPASPPSDALRTQVEKGEDEFLLFDVGYGVHDRSPVFMRRGLSSRGAPQQPTNPELTPANSFCLIPKAPLRAGATYTVQAEVVREKKVLTWSFKT